MFLIPERSPLCSKLSVRNIVESPASFLLSLLSGKGEKPLCWVCCPQSLESILRVMNWGCVHRWADPSQAHPGLASLWLCWMDFLGRTYQSIICPSKYQSPSKQDGVTWNQSTFAVSTQGNIVLCSFVVQYSAVPLANHTAEICPTVWYKG